MPQNNAGEMRHVLGVGDLEVKDEYVCLYIPSLDRNLEPIDHEHWRDQAIEIMSRLFGGATAVDATGGWFDPECLTVKLERISVVFSMIAAHEWNRDNVLEVRRFLHKLGRDAKQGEVALMVMGQLLRIRDFDSG